MITMNVIQRVFRIRHGASTGTAFAMDRAGRQYIVTARHLLQGAENYDKIDLFHEQQWKVLDVKVVGLAPGDADIAVLAPEFQLAPDLPLEPSPDGIGFGQQVFFLGFPLGMMGHGGELNREFPLPLVKSGTLSGIEGEPNTRFLVDGHNNPGFSGGPLVFTKASEPRGFKVAGVISGYRLSMLPVYDQSGNQIGLLPENSGIVIAHSIKAAVELADANPIGFELPDSPEPMQESN